jgi:predicted DNA-binding transcriptional regulator AlpA
MNPWQASDCESPSGNGLETLLNEHDVARITRMSVAAVRRWRLLNYGPPNLKLGCSVRYDPRAVRDWLASRPAGGERSQKGCQ